MWIQFFAVGATAFALRTGLRVIKRLNIKAPDTEGMRSIWTNMRGLDGFGNGIMSKTEAIRILNISPSHVMDADKIRDVHRRLLLANHPDRGGSTYISTKINEAKETLMGKKK